MAAPRVLLIESDSGTAVPLGAALRAIGAEVSSVPDGETGLQLAESTLPQLVVLAVELPGISGYSVCKNLRRSPTTGLLPIFLMSTTATEEIFAQHKRLPTRATEYFTKPLNVDALVEAARGVLGIEAAPADDLAGLIENEIAQALESDLFAPDDSVLPDTAAAVETSRGGGQATPAVSVDVVRLSRPTVDSAAAGEAAAEELGAARRAQADAEARLSDSMARAQEAEASVARLELTVATSAAQLAAVEQRAAAAEERARAAEARATEPPRAASDSTSATSARELLTLREALNGKEREVLELKDEIFKRDHRIIEGEEALASRDAELERTRDAHAKTQSEAAALAADLAVANQRVVDASSAAQAAAAAHAEETAAAATKLAEESARATAAEERAAELEFERDAVSAELAQLKAGSAELEAGLEAARGEIAQMQARGAELEAGLEALRSDRDAVAAARDSVSTERDGLAAELATAREQIAALEAAVAATAEERDAARAEASLLRESLDEAHSRGQETERRLTVELEGVRGELGEARAELEAAGEALRSVSSEKSALDASLASTQEEVARLGEELAAANAGLATALGELTDAKAAIVAAERATDDTRVAAERAMAETLRMHAAELESTRETAEAALAHTRDAAAATTARAAETIAALEADAAAAVQAAATLREDRDALAVAYRDREAELIAAIDETGIQIIEVRAGFEAKLRAADQTIEALGEDVRALAKHRRELRAALDTAREQVGAVAAAIGADIPPPPLPEAPEPRAGALLVAYAETTVPELRLPAIPEAATPVTRTVDTPTVREHGPLGEVPVVELPPIASSSALSAPPVAVDVDEPAGELTAAVDIVPADQTDEAPEILPTADDLGNTPNTDVNNAPADVELATADEADDVGDEPGAESADDSAPSAQSAGTSVRPVLPSDSQFTLSDDDAGSDEALPESDSERALTSVRPVLPSDSQFTLSDDDAVDDDEGYGESVELSDEVESPEQSDPLDALLADMVDEREYRPSASRSFSESGGGPSLPRIDRSGSGSQYGISDENVADESRGPSLSDDGPLVPLDPVVVESPDDLVDLDPTSIDVDADAIDEDDFI